MTKNLLAILFGFFISALLFAAAESFFRINATFNFFSYPKRVAFFDFDQVASKKLFLKLKDSPAYQWEPLGPSDIGGLQRSDLDLVEDGFFPCCIGRREPVKSGTFHSSLIDPRTKRVVSRARYTFDEFGRRLTPTSSDPAYNLLFFGGSFTMGQAVDDEETAPYRLGLMRPRAQVYNFGVAGGSANEFLYELEMDPSPRLAGIPNRKSLVLYVFIESHYDRLFCPSLCVRQEHNWVINKPYYVRSGGEIIFNGFFDTNRKFQNGVYRLFNASALFGFFDIVWPLFYTEWHHEFFADLLLKAKVKSQQRFVDSDLYLVLFPGASHTLGKKLKSASEAKGIKVLDYSELMMNIVTGGKFEVPLEQHPTPVAQYVFSYLLNRDLPTYE